MKKTLFIILIAINFATIGFVINNQKNSSMSLTKAVAEDTDFEISTCNEGSESFTTTVMNPDGEECSYTFICKWFTVTCSGSGNVPCTAVDLRGSCYIIDCGEGNMYNYSDCPCQLVNVN